MAVPYGENQFIYGLHDPGGEALLIHRGQAKGWVLVTEEIRANPNDQGGKGDFYKRLADRGLGVLVRLNHAYGPDGTIPLEAKYRDFAQRVANFVKNSPGAHIWIIGNEMNFEREQPRLRSGSRQAEPITPRRYAECYKLCRQMIKSLPGHADDQVVVGAIGPWNGETPYEADPAGQYPANKIPNGPQQYPYNGFFGDFILYLRDVLLAIGRKNCDAIAIHAYSHGYDPGLITSNAKMDTPFQKYNFNFRTYRDQMKIIPQPFRDLPVYLTEANGDRDPNGAKWPDVNSGWIKTAYREINDWNQAGNQQIRCMILYRWSRDDDWHIDSKAQVQQDFKEAVAQNYQWRPTMQAAEKDAQGVEIADTRRAADRPNYRTRFGNHNTPTTVSAGQTLSVSLTVQNAGGNTWVRAGANPFRLGFQWYTLAGQMVEFSPELNFRTSLPSDVAPGQTVTLQAQLRTPETAGSYHLRWDMLHEQVTWFTSQGDQGLLISPVVVNPAQGAGPVQTSPAATSLQIQNVIASLPSHPSKKYPLRSRSSIHRLIIHHTATPASVSVERIASYQVKDRDLAGITYHYCVDAAGNVFQTQPPEAGARHAGNQSGDSLGICLIGNFTDNPPPQAQINATAALLAYLATEFNIGVDQIFGYSDLAVTGSPGATWPTWKGPLLAQVRSLMAAGPATPTPTPQPTPTTPTTPSTDKPIAHYLLLWHHGPDNWAKWDLMGAFEYIDQFPVTVGFSIDEAKSARYVTIVGGPGGVPTQAEQILRAAGCQVERLAGQNETETRQMFEQLAAQGRRFRTLSG